MKKLIIFLLAVLLPVGIYAQTPESEKRIYVLDVTKSMAGNKDLPNKTEDIFNQVLDSLIATVNSIEDPATEIVIVPFTNTVHPVVTGTIEKKDSLIGEIRKITTRDGDTNIADAWEAGLTHLDTTKANYLFLLTDGRHNTGPGKEVLHSRLREWPSRSADRYFFAFYVMLTKNAYDNEIERIAAENKNMWPIKSMNINAVFLCPPLSLEVNVNDSLSRSYEICISSTNSRIPLRDIGVDMSMDENEYYSISDFKPCSSNDTSENISDKRCLRREYFSFTLSEKKGRSEMPVDFETRLALSHSGNMDSLYFVFLTPETVKLKISNEGIREVFISEDGTPIPYKGCKNIGVVKFKEPFQGLLKYCRPVLEPTLNYPPFKWFRPDTAVVGGDFNITYSDDAVRSKSSIRLEMQCDDKDWVPDHLVTSFTPGFSNGFEHLVMSNEENITYSVKVLPGLNDTRITGTYYSWLRNIDKINGSDAIPEGALYKWILTYQEKPAIILWLLWLLLLVVILYLLYWLIKAIVMLVKHLIGALAASDAPSGSIPGTTVPVAKRRKRKTEKTNNANDDEEDDDDDDDCPCDKKLWNSCKVLKDKEASISDKCIALEKYHDYWCSLSEKKQKKIGKKMCPVFKVLYDEYWNIKRDIPEEENGEWRGEKGNGVFSYSNIFKPKLDDARNGMTWGELVGAYRKDFKLRGQGKVKYVNGRIDLSDYVIEKVTLEIDEKEFYGKSPNDISRILQAKASLIFDEKMKDSYKKKGYDSFGNFKDGIKDGKFVRSTPLVIHPDYDGKTFLLVPKFLHDSWPHWGGVAMIDFVVNKSATQVQKEKTTKK